MSTDLEAELLQAADRAAIRAQETDERTAGVRWRHLRGIHEAEAARLRQRAACFREALAYQLAEYNRGNLHSGLVLVVLEWLTGPNSPGAGGPIPAAETAPNERKEP